jgi:hypothetical protein
VKRQCTPIVGFDPCVICGRTPTLHEMHGYYHGPLCLGLDLDEVRSSHVREWLRKNVSFLGGRNTGEGAAS